MPEHRHVFPQGHRGAQQTVAIALGITAAIGVVEVLGALVSNSLSLLGDAIHNFIDTTALGIAFASLSVLAQAPSRRQTFGYQHTEVLGAWVNGIALLLVSAFIAFRAVERFLRPEPVQGLVMLRITAWARPRSSSRGRSLICKSMYE